MIKLFRFFWIVLFMVGSVIPLFHMNMGEITEQENRTLAKLPQITNKGVWNNNYGEEFEAWVGDRFWGRTQLIDFRFKALYKINGRIENEKAFIGDDGWMFEKKHTINRPPIKRQREKIEKDAKTLKRFADRFKGKNIPIYLVLIPERDVLYQKYWENYCRPKSKLNYGKVITELLENTPIKIINLENEMLHAMEEADVYYKEDAHLSSFGRHKILLGKVYSVLAQDELQNVRRKPVLTVKTKKKAHSVSLAAELGLLAQKEFVENTYTFMYPASKWKEIDSYRYFPENAGAQYVYRIGEVEEPYINKTFVSIGPCYAVSIFDLFKPIFKRSEIIRFNTSEKTYATQKTAELFNLEPDSAIIVITQSDLSVIESALNQTNK